MFASIGFTNLEPQQKTASKRYCHNSSHLQPPHRFRHEAALPLNSHTGVVKTDDSFSMVSAGEGGGPACGSEDLLGQYENTQEKPRLQSTRYFIIFLYVLRLPRAVVDAVPKSLEVKPCTLSVKPIHPKPGRARILNPKL